MSTAVGGQEQEAPDIKPTSPASTTRAATGMGAITALSRALGAVRVLVVATILGTSYLGDAFNSANLVSNVLFEMLAAGALSAVLVPSFVELLESGDKEGAERAAGGVLGVALLALGGVSLIGVLAAPWIAQLLTFDVAPSIASSQRDLITYLLRFFIPQVMLYACGTVAMAVLHALRRFAITAAAPIGNTVVMVASLLAFRIVAGPNPDLDLSGIERLLLVLAATGGVVGFVGTLVLACRAAGFRLWPRWPGRDRQVLGLLRHSGWGVALHTAGGVLLGAAVVGGTAVEGGVVAYQAAWVLFLGPYGVLAHPLQTAVLPEMASEAKRDGATRVVASLRWAVERVALFILPVTAAMMALALPAMRLVRFGGITEDGVGLLAAALAGLALGLLAYSTFLLLARGWYALGDSRTPGVAALISSVAGVVVMAGAVAVFDGAALVGGLGVGHTVAYTVGAVLLTYHLRRRSATNLWSPVVLRIAAVSAVAGLVMWRVTAGLSPEEPGKMTDLALLAVGGLVGTILVLGGYRLLGVTARLSQRVGPEGAPDAPSTT